MNVRAIALSLPLALAAACTHAGLSGDTGGRWEQGGRAAGREPDDPAVAPKPGERSGRQAGHAADRVVVGRIAGVSPDTVSIETEQGEEWTLQIAPQTAIELDGEAVSPDALTEGQPVRASFGVVDGNAVAVRIRAGDSDAGGAGAAPDAGWGPPPSGATAPSPAR